LVIGYLHGVATRFLIINLARLSCILFPKKAWEREAHSPDHPQRDRVSTG
jgi:hypothetical protein